MLSFREVGRRREIWMLAAVTVAVITVGRWAVPDQAVAPLVAKTGYWFVLAATLGLAALLVQLMRQGGSGLRWDRSAWAVAALIALFTSVWHAHERFGFKILADEVLLLGTSMTMHYERETAYPVRASDAQGPLQLVDRVLDKRPFFFPFVVSLVHDLTGYRPTNPFYVNAVLGVLFLGLVYLIGREVGGSPWAGAAGVALFGGLPLLAQQAAGGGFELLNLCMLATVLLLAVRYLRAPDDVSCAALCFAGVLLALTRYESVVMVVPVALIVLAGWFRVGRVVLPWITVAVPVFLLPYLLQNRVFELNRGFWELGGKAGATTPFSLAYVPDNIGHALAFFFDTSDYQANSVVFAALGLLALPFFALVIVRVLRSWRTADAAALAAALVGVGLFAITLLLMVYFWGQFDHPVIRRLSLPVHLLMFLALVVVGAGLWRRAVGWQALGALALGGFVLQGLPMLAKQAYNWDHAPNLEMAWRAEFLARHPSRDFLFIDRDSIFWITQRLPATPVEQAKLRQEGLAFHLRNRSFSAIYVFQRYNSDDQTGTLTLEPADDIGPDFELEPVEQKRIATLVFARISRVTAIRSGGKVVARAADPLPAATPVRTPEELKKAKALYLENWIKQLP